MYRKSSKLWMNANPDLTECGRTVQISRTFYTHMNTKVGRFCTRFKESVLQPRPEGGQLVRRDCHRISDPDLILKEQVIMEVVTHR